MFISSNLSGLFHLWSRGKAELQAMLQKIRNVCDKKKQVSKL
jgi:hypothetical protein